MAYKILDELLAEANYKLEMIKDYNTRRSHHIKILRSSAPAYNKRSSYVYNQEYLKNINTLKNDVLAYLEAIHKITGKMYIINNTKLELIDEKDSEQDG